MWFNGLSVCGDPCRGRLSLDGSGTRSFVRFAFIVANQDPTPAARADQRIQFRESFELRGRDVRASPFMD